MDSTLDKEQDALLQRRLQGILPQIDIAGNMYFIDVRVKELRLTKAAHISLPFREMELDTFTDEYSFLYNKTTKSIYPSDADPAQIPKNTFIVLIPDDRRLDQVAYARMNNHSIESMLKMYPIQPALKAETKQVDEPTKQMLIKYHDRLLFMGLNDLKEMTDMRNNTSAQEVKKEIPKNKKKGKHL